MTKFLTRSLQLMAIFALTFNFAATNAQAEEGYDLESSYANPIANLPAGCSARVTFYRVVRPLFPLVNHVYVAALIDGQCGGVPFNKLAIYGASKGASDKTFLDNEIVSGDLHNQELIGTANDAAAISALNQASRISLEWQSVLKNPIYRYARVVATPLMGRPCAKSAKQVMNAVRPFLAPLDN